MTESETTPPAPETIAMMGAKTMPSAKKTASSISPRVKAALDKAKGKKAKSEKVAEGPKPDLMTFALRIDRKTSAALHKAAGKGRASKVVGALITLYISANDGDRIRKDVSAIVGD